MASRGELKDRGWPRTAMVDPRVAVWDLGPLPVVIREAGGRYTDLRGREEVLLDAEITSSSVATNGRVHDELLALIGG